MLTLQTACSKKTKNKHLWLFPILLLGTALSFVLSLFIGAASISVTDSIKAMLFGDISDVNYRILVHVRLPRAVAAVLSGAALAVSGVIIQNVLNNPLAAPNIIGVNSGAGFALLLIIAFFPAATGLLPMASFLGALIACLLIYAIAARAHASRTTITLAGVAVSSIFTACSNAVKTFFPDTIYNSSTFFVGGFSGIAWQQLTPAWVMILISLLVAILLSGSMDILALGDDTAATLGAAVRPMRLILLITASLLAGSAVSFSGMLSFVGLIIPHILRRFVGQRHRLLIPLSAIGGAWFVLLCDTLSRVLFAPYEIPVGIILSLLGGPFFIFLLLSEKKGGRHE